MVKRGVVLLVGLIILLITATAYAESTTIKIISYVNPIKVIEAIRSEPFGLYFIAGKYFFNSGDLNRAEYMFSKAIEYNPDFSPAYHNLGVIYYTWGDHDRAKEEFERAVESNPEYSKAYYSMGILNFELGEYDSAIENLLEAVNLEPENPNINFDLAQSFVARFRGNEPEGTENFSDLEQALIYLGRAKEIEPNFPYIINNIEIIESIVNSRRELLN